jgi:aromatic-L-amino-acid decarboxylase
MPGEPAELTLDPADWDEFRALAHRMLDDMIDHLSTLRSRPAWQPMPARVRERLDEPLPVHGEGAEAAYRDFALNVLPYSNGNRGPRFFGWVQGTGTPLGMMADMLASGMNPHLAGFDQAPAFVEHQVLRWFIEIMGFPPGASGVLTLGGSMANILGLAVARNSGAGFDVREAGLAAGAEPLSIYASTETHSWLKKAVELLGLGRSSLRPVPVDGGHRLEIPALQRMIREDRQAGRKPLCVVGTVGTINIGATDDLSALAHLCREEGLWFHVDGAFGALVRFSERLRPIAAGIEEADSLAFDLHKWMYQPFDVACLLVRDGALHHASFASSANYLAPMNRGVIAGGLPFADLGVDLTRGFRALKLWMSLKAHGVETFARLIEQNVDQAQHLARRIAEHPELELLAPVPLNIVCFRFAPPGATESDLDRINQEVLLRIQETGIAVPSSTLVEGRFALRCALVNHRSRREDLDVLVEAVIHIGHQVLAGTPYTAPEG